MSQENVERTRRAFAALQRGDVAWLQEMSTPDVVMVQPPEVPDAKSYEGRAGVIEMLEDWPTEWEDFRVDLIEIIDVSDDVVVSVMRQRGRGRHSGIEMDFQVFFVNHARDGKLARMEIFFSREQALNAAGLKE
jgi:ketosteroid isomerase-like protein